MRRLAVFLVSGVMATGSAWGAACTSPSLTTGLDLTTAGASGFINGAFFQQVPDQSTGTGVIDPFVRLSTNDNCEQAAKQEVDAPHLKFWIFFRHEGSDVQPGRQPRRRNP